MGRYNVIYRGPAEMNMPHTEEAAMNAATAPGTLVIKSSGKFAPHATQGTRPAFFILDKGNLTQSSVDDNIAANDTGVGFLPYDTGRFAVLVETGTNCVKDVTLLTNNTSGVLEVATSGDEVLFVADETYNNTTGSNQLVSVRPYKGSVA